MMDYTQLPEEIRKYLVRYGIPTTADTLSFRFGVPKSRIRRAVNVLRDEGHPIIASHRGYQLSDDEIEIKRQLEREESRRDAMVKRIAQLRRNISA